MPCADLSIPNRLARDLDHILDHTRELWDEIRGERLFMTGGTGFVGTWLTESLLWANRRLAAKVELVLLTRDAERFRRQSPHLACDPAVLLHTGDATAFAVPAGSFSLIVHAATERWFAPCSQNPTGIFTLNIEATRHVLELAGSCGARRMLFTSSGAVYGTQPPELPRISEDYPGGPSPIDPHALYGHSKVVSELLCACYGQVSGLHLAIARLFAFLGPHLPLHGGYAAGNFLRDILAGGPIQIVGDGTPYRSYLYAADLDIWLWTILLRGKPLYPYNVGSAEAISILDLAGRMRDIVAPGMEIRIARQAMPGQLRARYVPSVARAETELGLRSWISLEEGIRRSAVWHSEA